jgi:hypothetical protein
VLNELQSETTSQDVPAAQGTPALTIRGRALNEANRLVNGDRNNQYGDPNQDFKRTAALWESYLRGAFEQRGDTKVMAHDVGIMMMLLKISRISWSPSKMDSIIDAIGYGACAADCIVAEYDVGDQLP